MDDYSNRVVGYAQELRETLFRESLHEKDSIFESISEKGWVLSFGRNIVIVLTKTAPNGDQTWYVPRNLLPTKFILHDDGDFCTVVVNSENSNQIINGILSSLKPGSERQEDSNLSSIPILSKRLIGLRLANFKAFGEEQYIPIRPLTLIFGPNSGGKSSIIQGLIFANEAVRTGNLDAFSTQLGGSSIDLGGFRQYIHKGQLDKLFDLSLCFDAENVSTDCRFGSIFDDYMRSISFKVTVGMQPDYEGGSRRESAPIIRSFSVVGDGDTLLRIAPRPDGFFGIDHIAREHLMFRDLLGDDFWRDKDNNQISEAFDKLISMFRIPISILLPAGIENDPGGAYTEEKWVKTFVKFKETPKDLEIQYYLDEFRTEMDHFVGELSRVVRRVLERLQYLGPLRSYPSRDLVSKEHYDPNWFAGGGYAWDVVRKDAEVRKKVNAWLGDNDKLRTPYEFVSRDFKPTDEVKSDHTIQKLSLLDKRSGTEVTHRDVGIGISQVLPVLVSAYASTKRIIAMEQPEIHLHPALQAELADVFIESAMGNNQNTFILETHSEHLILRILRRIRDTHRGKNKGPRLTHDDVAVLFVTADKGGSRVVNLPITEDGDFETDWPEGFFEEREKELFD
jgi:hypothetical protein